MMTPERGKRFTDIVRSLQPNTLIDGRLGTEGDYRSTGDNVIPPEASTEAWEMPATINHTWGFRNDDTNWKSPGQIAFKLVDIVSKGGNYLLNVGPTAEGVIPQASQDILRTVGRWLQGQRRGGLRRRAHAVRRRARRAQRDGARRTCAATSCFCRRPSGASRRSRASCTSRSSASRARRSSCRR